MALFVLLALIAIPIAEIAVIIKVGGLLGLWPTLALIILTAVAGSMLLRLQGLATLQRAQASLERQEFPIAEVFDGLCLLVAGALLLTPGFITDALGLLLFVPPFRRFVRNVLYRRLAAGGHIHMTTTGGGPRAEPPGRIIEGEYDVVDDDKGPRNGGGENRR